MKRHILFAFCLVLLVAVAANAQQDRTRRFEDIRALGMGGAGLTTLESFQAVIYNPARLATFEHATFDLLSLQLGVGKDVIDLLDFVDKNQDRFEDFDNLTRDEQKEFLDEMTPYDENWMGVSGYPSIGLAMKNFAVGVYGAGRVDFMLDKGIWDPRIFGWGLADLIVTGGIGFQVPKNISQSILPNTLYAGASFKYIERRFSSLRLQASNTEIESVYDSLKENTYTGFGVDVGFIYDFIPERSQIAVTAVDLIADLDRFETPVIVNVGGHYHLTKRILLAADYRDVFFHYGGNVFNRLYFGAEANLASILYARGGVGQGYPSVGAGLNLKVLKIDVAIYGIERTRAPGGDGDYNYTARLRVGI